MRIRFRTDSDSQADDAARVARGQKPVWYERAELVGVTPAQPGDCWRLRWYKPEGEGPVAGYSICCPKCRQVHHWTTALNCGTKNSEGVCSHNGLGSCWTWTGSAEAGTLSASPSLFAIDQGGSVEKADGHGCGWHGWLTNGDLSPDS